MEDIKKVIEDDFVRVNMPLTPIVTDIQHPTPCGIRDLGIVITGHDLSKAGAYNIGDSETSREAWKELYESLQRSLLQRLKIAKSRAVLVTGLVGKLASLNGLYEEMLDMHNGKILFRKQGGETSWLRFLLSASKWAISSTASKDANSNKCLCISVKMDIEHPTQADSWKINQKKTNGTKGTWELAPMKCTAAPVSTSFCELVHHNSNNSCLFCNRNRAALEASQDLEDTLTPPLTPPWH
jgi:hypothetical protein